MFNSVSTGLFLLSGDGVINSTRSVYPGATGDNIDGVATFVDAPGGDYRLAPGSLGIDGADHDAYVAAGSGDTDLNGDPRLVGCALDMGAYEFQVPQAGPVENVDEGTFHCTIQDCIALAEDTQECVVPPGTYFENINFNGKAITLRSTDPTDPTVVAATIIDGGGGTVVTCSGGEGPLTVLSGFTITGGDSLEVDWAYVGDSRSGWQSSASRVGAVSDRVRDTSGGTDTLNQSRGRQPAAPGVSISPGLVPAALKTAQRRFYHAPSVPLRAQIVGCGRNFPYRWSSFGQLIRLETNPDAGLRREALPELLQASQVELNGRLNRREYCKETPGRL